MADTDTGNSDGTKTAAVTITEHPPQEITVASKRRIVITLDLADYDAGSLVDSVYEAAGYLDMHSEGGWRSDPRVLFVLVDAIQDEMRGPATVAAGAPSPGEFLASPGGDEDDGDDPPENAEGTSPAASAEDPAASEGQPAS